MSNVLTFQFWTIEREEWNARREWINLFIIKIKFINNFIIKIKFKTLQLFVFNFCISSILFHEKAFILRVHDYSPAHAFSLTVLLAHIKIY